MISHQWAMAAVLLFAPFSHENAWGQNQSPPRPAPSPLKAGEIKVNAKDGQKYVWIPPGTFTLGCSPGDRECFFIEEPAHQVTITLGFRIGQTPVTVGAYKRYAQARGRSMPPEPKVLGRALNPAWRIDAMPIVDVTRDQAQAFCRWMGGRLPSEAEWEYAARGGSADARYGSPDDIAWYADNSGNHRLDSARLWDEDKKNYGRRLIDNGNGMHVVGTKQPNAFGLYDILGNVWEWVNDWFDYEYYESSPAQDPRGPASGKVGILRGGSWEDPPRDMRVSNRVRYDPTKADVNNGFRCVW